MDFPVVFEHNKDGRWTVSCPVLPGCISEGETKQEAFENIKDAITLYLRAVRKELAILKKRHHVQVTHVAV